MAFDPKSIVKNPAFAIGGGFLIGTAIWHLLSATFHATIVPVFRAMGDGVLRMGNVHLDCFTVIFAGTVGLVAIAIGAIMIKVSSKE